MSENYENLEKGRTSISNKEGKSAVGSAFKQRDDHNSEINRKEDHHSSAGQIIESHKKNLESGDQRTK